MKELNIIPECYVDTKVIEIVARASGKLNHQHGCGNVAHIMKERFKDRIVLGIIDEDKGKGPSAKYFSAFSLIREENNLILKRHAERKHYIVLICPEAEKWLLNDAEHVKLKLKDFELPEDLAGFKQIIKVKNIDKNIKFYDFIKEMIKLRAPSITTLSEWIGLFKGEQIDKLKVG